MAPDTLLAQSAATRQIDIAAGPLAVALEELGRETGISVGTEGPLPARRVSAVRGTMSPQAALSRLLAGSGYVARQVGRNVFRIEVEPAVGGRSPPPLLDPRQTPSVPPPTTYGNPIVVTATKREQSLATLPLAVTVVRFESDGVRDAHPDTASIQRQIEGLALSGQGPGQRRIFLRGVADSPFTGSTQSTVAVVLDAARVTWSAPDPDLRLIDVDRVEVVKGPQGALYGTGALGGIYHIVSNRPDLSETSARIEAGPDVVGSGDRGAHGSAVLNLPIMQDRVAVRLSAYGSTLPGWIETGTRSDSNRLRVGGGRAALRWREGGWTVDLAGQLQRLNSADSQYVYSPGRRSRPEQLAEPHDNDFTHTAAEISGPVGAIRLHLTSSLTWHEVGETFDASVGADTLGLANPVRFFDDRNYRVADSEARLSGELGKASWVVGLGHVQARENLDRLLTSTTPAVGSLVVNQLSRNATDTALFGEATLPLGRAFAATFSARLYHDSISDRVSGPGGKAAREARRTGVSPALSVSWHPDSGGLAYLRYGSALRQGGLDLLGGGGNGGALESDELQTVELGLRRQLPGGGQLEFSAYATDWKHLQSDFLQANGLFASRNAGRARILGGEASLDARLSRGWHLWLGAALQDARLIDNELGIELEDRRLPVVPLYTLRTRIEHGFAWLGDNRATIAGELHYDGPARLSFDPALDRPMGNVLDARLGGRIALGRWSLAAQLDNLFDGRANQFAYGNPFRLRTSRQYVPAAPTRASLSLAAAF